MKRQLLNRLFLVVIIFGTLSGGLQAANLTVNFDTQFLGTFPTPGMGEFGVWSNGQTISDDNIWVSFQSSAAGNFSATIMGQTLAYTVGGNWTYGNSTYTNVMSPSFSVSQLNTGGGFTVSNVQGHNMYIEYGTNTINATTPPGVGAPIRYTTVEWTYVSGSSNNNADLTYINNIGASLNLKYAGSTSNASLGLTQTTSQTLPNIASQSPASVIVSSSTPTGTPSLGSNGSYVAGIQGASSFTPGDGFFAHYPTVIANAISGNLSSPLLTNIPGGNTPTPSDRVLGQGFDGTIPSISANATNYQLSMAFTPSFTEMSGVYQITLNGTITAVPPGWTGNLSESVTYGSISDPLSIVVEGTSDSFYGFLQNGNVNQSVVTLGGNSTAWQLFSTEFYNGGSSGGGGSGSQGAPDMSIAMGGNSTNSTYYGQIVQRALGDLQELMMIGAFGNSNMGLDSFSTVEIGNIPSYDIWQNKAYAYATGNATIGFNPTGKDLWLNSEFWDGINPATVGAVYSNPYDDRFGQGVYLPMESDGGTLTIQLYEIVPEPSSVALLAIAGGCFVLLARQRQRSSSTRVPPGS
ncbi:MAG: hypothetical protein Fur0032_04390 [Terrimicrobiaceae bacterium]